MTIIEAILLGLIQGVTEFLPVSSSGHLAVIENLFQMDDGAGLLFPVVLHLGTLAAVCMAFSKDIHRLLAETVHMLGDLLTNLKSYIRNKTHQDALRYRKIIHNNYRKFALLLWISTLPTAVIGILFRDTASSLWGGLLGPCLLYTSICSCHCRGGL